MRVSPAQKRSFGVGLLALAAFAALAALSVNRFTDGPPAFGGGEQLVLALAAAGAVIGLRLATSSWEVTAVAAIIALPVIFRLGSTDDPLQEAHAFRQTQTAYTALVFSQEGIDLLHPGPPVLGPPFEVPFEFPLFQAIAVVPLELQLPSDAALRLTGLGFFIVTSLLLYGLIRHVAGIPASIAALALFMASPFALLWSRTSMIEYLATAGAVGFAWMTIRWREDGRPVHAVLALTAGSVGMLVKPTTAAFWILPALAWRLPDARTARKQLRSLLSPTLAALVAIPLVLALLWTQHADSVKEGSEITGYFTSERLQTAIYGTLDQRLDWGNWSTILDRLLKWMAGPALLLLPLAALAAWRSGQRLFWLAMALTVLLPPAVFFNLYVAHDYYQAAIAPGCAAVLGLGAGWAWAHLSVIQARRAVVAAVAAVALWVTVFADGYWKAENRLERPGGVEFGRELGRVTDPDEQVMTIGLPGDGWSPDILYYARRKGLMIFDQFFAQDFLAKQRDDYSILFDADPARLAETLAQWPWVGAIGERVYAMGERPGDIPGSALSATSDAAALPADARRLAVAPTELTCDTPMPMSVQAGRRGTWLRIEPGSGALISASGYSPVPARQLVAIAPGPRRVAVSCTGATQLRILEVFDAPPPVSCRPPRPYRWTGCASEPPARRS